MKIVVEIAK